ncbi:hypothetical protein TYRP_015035 [Tyrophagus putrescentiae]|nr:hypothetical protein TYRP_015035 [Tyrophagus putrescentiae]
MNSNTNNLIYVRTPLIESIPLRKYLPSGRNIFLKLENTQPSGSFKMRGVSEVCRHAQSLGYSTVVCASSGNAGLATALSARALGLRCHIVVFRAIPEEEVRAKIRALGATVEEHGTVWDETYQRALEITTGSKEKFLVHPFDHPLLWKGHSTMIQEIQEDLRGQVPSLLVTVCGGGGLVSGLVEGVRAAGWALKTKLLVMETTGAASFNACAVGGPGVKVRFEQVNSIASSLITKEVCDRIVENYALNEPDSAVESGLVKRVLEGDDVKEFDLPPKENFEGNDGNGDGPVVVIVCGGAEVTFDLLKEWSEKNWEN